jgi:hypothetical protein
MSVKKFRFSILALAFAVLFVAGAKSSMAQSATTTSTTIKEPLNYNAALTCDTFEPITFSGFQKTVYDVKNFNDGSPRRVKMTVTWDDVVGTTTSGRVYKASSTSREEYDVDGLPSYHRISITQRFKSKTKGAADTVYTLKLKVKVDVDGSVTQDKEDERVDCK